MTIRERDVVRVYAGTKNRIGVVMRIFPEYGRAVVITGTSKHYAGEVNVEVKCQERAGKALGLTTPVTFFRKSGFARPKLEEIELLNRRCPPNLFLDLQRLLGFVSFSNAPVSRDGSEDRRDIGELVSVRIQEVLGTKSSAVADARNTNERSSDATHPSEADALLGAIVASRQSLREQKTSEAKHTLRAIARALTACMEREDDGGRRRSTFPASAPRTPPEIPRGIRFVPTEETWGHSTWRTMRFAINGVMYFSYEIETAQDGRTATIRASAYLNGDERVTILEQGISLDSDNRVLLVSGIIASEEVS